MKKRYVIIATTAIAASLTACGVYGPMPDDLMYEGNEDGIVVERLEDETPATDTEENEL